MPDSDDQIRFATGCLPVDGNHLRRQGNTDQPDQNGERPDGCMKIASSQRLVVLLRLQPALHQSALAQSQSAARPARSGNRIRPRDASPSARNSFSPTYLIRSMLALPALSRLMLPLAPLLDAFALDTGQVLADDGRLSVETGKRFPASRGIHPASRNFSTSSGWQTSTRSQPASRQRRVRCCSPPMDFAACMPRSSEKMTPW